jgi:hypothetical protein
VDEITENPHRHESHDNKTPHWRRYGREQDKSNHLIVENIPGEKCNEQTIEEYFRSFGLSRLELNTEKRIAYLYFNTHEEARNCHKSPDAIFGNRFVKIFWKPIDDKEEARNKEQIRISLQLDQDMKLLEMQKQRNQLVTKHMRDQESVIYRLKNEKDPVQKQLLMDKLKDLQEGVRILMEAQVQQPDKLSEFEEKYWIQHKEYEIDPRDNLDPRNINQGLPKPASFKVVDVINDQQVMDQCRNLKGFKNVVKQGNNRILIFENTRDAEEVLHAN